MEGYEAKTVGYVSSWIWKKNTLVISATRKYSYSKIDLSFAEGIFGYFKIEQVEIILS